MKSGLISLSDGTRAFVDFDCEERWIQSMVEHNAAAEEEEQRQERLYQESLSYLDRRAAEDDDVPWRKHERPHGLMFHVA